MSLLGLCQQNQAATFSTIASMATLSKTPCFYVNLGLEVGSRQPAPTSLRHHQYLPDHVIARSPPLGLTGLRATSRIPLFCLFAKGAQQPD